MDQEIDFIDNIILTSKDPAEALVVLNDYSSRINNEFSLNNEERSFLLLHIEATKALYLSDTGRKNFDLVKQLGHAYQETTNGRLIIVGGQNFINFGWFVYYSGKCIKAGATIVKSGGLLIIVGAGAAAAYACDKARYYFNKIINSGGFVDPCENSNNPCCGISCVLSHYCDQNGSCVPLPDFDGCPNVPCPPDHLCRSSDGTCIPI
ncbi:hypothetical protein [Pararhodonellum marinum]|uniref:hypothetical protein n=1 Tax=Pararhodonellum marinum TaxID=2755358 RepID=UPI0018903A7C|nr:hypothetical protein [Pararhodonellum marinum]